MQQFHMLWSENNEKDAHTGEVTSRPTETFDKAHLDWICPVTKTIGIVLVAALAANADGRSDAKIAATLRFTNFSRKGRQVIVVTICSTEFDTYVPPFDKAGFLQSLSIESRQ